jgi:uncharacterized protein YkwD
MKPNFKTLLTLILILTPPGAGTVLAQNQNLTQAITDEINTIRVNTNLQALQPDRRLSALAGAWSEVMAKRNKLFHRQNLREQMRTHGYHSINENIYYSTGPTSAKAVVEAWMNSPGHRRNLLDPRMNRIGVGQAINAAGTTFFTYNSALEP